MGALPEFAPQSENHLLRSTSIVQKITYGARSVAYATFDPAATEVFHLNFKPARVASGTTAMVERNDLTEQGYTVRPLPGGDYVVRVKHATSREISITG